MWLFIAGIVVDPQRRRNTKIQPAINPDDHVRVTMPHDLGDPKRVFSAT